MITETIFVIDDDETIRASLDSLLRSMGHETELFGSPQRFAERWFGKKPIGCLLLDVRLPGANGLDFQRMLAEADIQLPIIFMTGHGDVPMSVQAMKAGAAEFLIKPFRDQDLLDAIHHALEQNRLEREEDRALGELMEAYGSLTLREREIMGLVVEGHMNKQIATAVNLSEVTVKVHRAALMKKMKASCLADLVRMAEKIESQTKGSNGRFSQRRFARAGRLIR